MSQPISRIAVILACPVYENDFRANLPREMAKKFVEGAQRKGLFVDVIDLYQDDEFNPVWQPEQRDTKALEYQIRIKKAELLVFFHPIWWVSVPAILKGFVEKVFQPGFAYKFNKPLPIGLLSDKKAWVFAFSDRPTWEYRFIHRDLVKMFWKRGIFDQCAIKMELFKHFGDIRTTKEKILERWGVKIQQMAGKINSKDSILDLL